MFAVGSSEQHASHAMGMTLSQYMSLMPSREAVAGERCVTSTTAHYHTDPTQWRGFSDTALVCSRL